MKKFMKPLFFAGVFTVLISCQSVRTDLEKDMKNLEVEADKNENINA